MKLVNTLALAFVLAGSVGFAQEKNSVYVGKKTRAEMDAAQTERLAEICGDNLACYFSADELAEAFGGKMAVEAGLADLLRMDESDRYSEEDMNVYKEVMAAEARAKARKEARQAAEAALKQIAAQATQEVAPAKTEPQVKVADKKADKKVDTKKKTKKVVDNSPLKIIGIQARGYPIYASFSRNFRQCAPGCFPRVVSVNRPGAYSCHNGGRAIDVGGIICGGKTYNAIAEANYNGKFVAFKNCMKTKMKTLWHNDSYSRATVTSGHWDHAHFSNGCVLAGGHRYY
jgi:hypothetical protein